MDAGAPWMEALVQSDLPIVELTNSDLFGLDKDDNLGTQDFGAIEPQELEHVDNLSESSFCMLEPEVRINTPEPQTNSPEPQTFSPDLQAISPEPQTMSPEQQTMSPEPQMISPEPQMKSPEPQMKSPEPQMNTVAERFSTPDVEIVPQEIQLDSPEVFTIEDSPVKMQTGNSPKIQQAIVDNGRDIEKKLQVKLIKIDQTLTIINNMVRLPEHMCGSDSDTSSIRNGRRSSKASSQGLKSKVRRGQTVANKRSPYALRIKSEPADEADPSSSNTVRFNPYALSIQKPTANKRNSVSTKGKLAKGRQVGPSLSQPEEADNDYFSPLDFLEASMSEGNSPEKQKTWSGSNSSLLEKTLTLVGKRQPTKMIQNGTPVFVNAPASASAGMLQPQRLSSFRGGMINTQGEVTNTLAKVMANSSLSLTHRLKPDKVPGPAGAKKAPGQTGMVNHDHQYSSRLSNENVTRLETQIKSLQTENQVLNSEVEKLRKQLSAANTYIQTSLAAAVQQPTPNRNYQQTTNVRMNTQRTQAPSRFQTQPTRSNAQVFRAQTIQAQPQGNRAQTQVVRAQQFRAQTIRPQPMQRPRTAGPARATAYQRALNPGVMIAPVRKAAPSLTLRPLRTSTQALTVIPIQRGLRVAEPEAEMPSFEQVNVNEHFGMHFLTE